MEAPLGSQLLIVVSKNRGFLKALEKLAGRKVPSSTLQNASLQLPVWTGGDGGSLGRLDRRTFAENIQSTHNRTVA